MIKCTGYYSEPVEEIDYEHYERMGLDPPENEHQEMVETNAWIETEGIKAIFDTQDGKLVIYYDNGWDILIKNDKKVLDILIKKD